MLNTLCIGGSEYGVYIGSKLYLSAMKMSHYLRQGKSENYQDAAAKGLLKAGEVAGLLSKKFNTKILAKELSVFATEWHHAGVFKAGPDQSLRGRKVYFFSAADIEKISLEKILANRDKAAKKPLPDKRMVQGWYTQYFRMTDPVTRRTFSKPFVGIYKGPADKAPKGFKALSDEAFVAAEKQRGKELKPGASINF
ncbi:hypothetical protein CLV51_103247 [Chitinophaga niastensis]|uniref:Uncharacterized protein n=1 Tax=Chitinophaga niastensis TaxID=536980 RepID=A0A2P8HJ74_CHINA|nr:hypothetical protein [Chitinophaga niastensis]PSL46271.1 hypothetical protein CLV51_103247 [Chitinophaga niastensis]